MIEVHKSKTKTLSTAIDNLNDRTVTAERNLKRAQAQVNRSTKRSDDVMEYTASLVARIKELEGTIKQQQSLIVDLEVDVEEKNKQIFDLDGACPVKVFGKMRHGQRGATSWPLWVWELILEMLISGTPPSAVSANIVIFIQRFSPRTIIKESPSIWTIHRVARFFLLSWRL